MFNESLNQAIDEQMEAFVAIRRYLHQHPELSFKEKKTSQYICDFYDNLGITYERNTANYGVVARIQAKNRTAPTLAFRADFDALPIQDQKDVPYKSKTDGVMHACGHDGHTAILLVTAKLINERRDELKGDIVFIHQPAEELAPGGAKAMIDEGCLKDVDYVFGTHLWSGHPLGTVTAASEAFMASADRFTISIEGVGGHGAMPHETKDAVVIGSELVGQLQQIVSRRINPIDPAVLSVGTFNAGDAFNVIAGHATLEGTVRTFKETTQTKIIHEMEAIIAGIEHTYQLSIAFDYKKGYPAVINHPNEVDKVLKAARQIDQVSDAALIDPIMIGEDFSYFLKERKGAFFFTGAQLTEHFYPHHHPKFDFDERAMPIAAKTFFKIIDAYQI